MFITKQNRRMADHGDPGGAYNTSADADVVSIVFLCWVWQAVVAFWGLC